MRDMQQDLKLTCAQCGHVNRLMIIGAEPAFSVACSHCGKEMKVGGPESA